MPPNMGISNKSFPSHQAEQKEGTRLIPWESGEPFSFKSFTDFSFNTSSIYNVLSMLLREPDFFPLWQEEGLQLFPSPLQLACKSFSLC